MKNPYPEKLLKEKKMGKIKCDFCHGEFDEGIVMCQGEYVFCEECGKEVNFKYLEYLRKSPLKEDEKK